MYKVRDIVYARYLSTDQEIVNGLFCIIYAEHVDKDTPYSYNYTCCKITSNLDTDNSYSVTIYPDKDNNLKTVSILKANKLFNLDHKSIIYTSGRIPLRYWNKIQLAVVDFQYKINKQILGGK